MRSSASNESTSQHGSPEGFSPSDNFLDLSGAGMGSPQPPSAAFSPSSNGFGMSGTPGPSFSDAMDISNGQPQTMNPADLLAMFGGEGNLDIASLLMSPELAGQNLADTNGNANTNFFGTSMAGTSPSGMVSS